MYSLTKSPTVALDFFDVPLEATVVEDHAVSSFTAVALCICEDEIGNELVSQLVKCCMLLSTTSKSLKTM